MKTLVALYDRATESFAPVMTVHTRAEAIRSFRQAMNDPQTPMYNHPTDYELHQIGNYDDQSGRIEPTLPTTVIARGEDFKES